MTQSGGRMKTIPVSEFFSDHQAELSMRPLSDRLDGRLGITQPDLNRPGLLLAGYGDSFLNERIQILGDVEQDYLDSLDVDARRVAVDRLFSFTLPCVIVTNGRSDPMLVDAANRAEIPIFESTLGTTAFNHRPGCHPRRGIRSGTHRARESGRRLWGGAAFLGPIGDRQERVRARSRRARSSARRRRHGAHQASAGQHSHRCEQFPSSPTTSRSVESGSLMCRPSSASGRFGDRSAWRSRSICATGIPPEDYERLGLEDRTSRILGVELPMVEVPIFPGKNITVISEVIALNYLVKAYGVDPAQAFSDRLLATMEQKKKAQFRAIARGDRE